MEFVQISVNEKSLCKFFDQEFEFAWTRSLRVIRGDIGPLFGTIKEQKRMISAQTQPMTIKCKPQIVSVRPSFGSLKQVCEPCNSSLFLFHFHCTVVLEQLCFSKVRKLNIFFSHKRSLLKLSPTAKPKTPYRGSYKIQSTDRFFTFLRNFQFWYDLRLFSKTNTLIPIPLLKHLI